MRSFKSHIHTKVFGWVVQGINFRAQGRNGVDKTVKIKDGYYIIPVTSGC